MCKVGWGQTILDERTTWSNLHLFSHQAKHEKNGFPVCLDMICCLVAKLSYHLTLNGKHYMACTVICLTPHSSVKLDLKTIYITPTYLVWYELTSEAILSCLISFFQLTHWSEVDFYHHPQNILGVYLYIEMENNSEFDIFQLTMSDNWFIWLDRAV